MPNLLSFIPPAPQLRPPLLEAINESYGKVFLLVQKAGPDSIKDDITLARKVLALMPILNTGGRPAVPFPWAPSSLELDAGLLSRYRKASTGLHSDKFNSIPNITIYDEIKAGMLYKLGAAAKATIKGQPANDVQDAMPNPRSTDWSNNSHFHVTAQPWLAQPAWPEHPIRKPENRMPDSLPIPDPSERLNVLPETVRRVYSALPREKAQGASAWRYEMLTALAPSVPFASEAANEAVSCHAWFATGLANGDFPPWFNFVLAAVRLIPVHKSDQMPLAGETPDVRPIGISCALRRALTRTIFAEGELRDTLRDYLSPTQLAVF
ncbi:hypothetical protein T492DRAFT_981680, partial [Pavlovales sp. CCMP2436]